MWKIALPVQYPLLFVLLSHSSDIGVAAVPHQSYDVFEKVRYQYYVEKWLSEVESDLSEFNSLSAQLTWKLSVKPDGKSAKQASQLAPARNTWKNRICSSEIKSSWLTDEQSRKLYLLCRGPRFSDDLLMRYLETSGKLSTEYNEEICAFGEDLLMLHTIEPSGGRCVYVEPDLERIMRRTEETPDHLKWVWLTWHNSVGPRIRDLFFTTVQYQNEAAIANGYEDMGEIWREELEIPNLQRVVLNLYEEIKPLYILLHAVIRHVLYLKHGSYVVNPRGLIPIHLLGNMWGQEWTPLIGLLVPENKRIDFNARLLNKNMTVRDMVMEAEDFYTSLGFPRMTEKFWKYSIFEENNNISLCHGTAANLFTPDDYRMLMCGKTSMDDMYVIHHEMGHIEYYMAYGDQSSFFQDGTNTAFHESIGDAVWHGVMTPQHLHRLSLLNDDELVDDSTEFYLLLYQALNKIPEIPFSLLIDLYRWKIFDGSISYEDVNRVYWDYTKMLRGIAPPEERSEEYFDAGGKFHIPDNTPYIRYFLSSIIQLQLFKHMCEGTLSGVISNERDDDISLPFHRCDIYGSKKSGKILRNVMGKGSSIRFGEAMKMISGTEEVSTKPLLDYYKPIYDWLVDYTEENNVFVGW